MDFGLSDDQSLFQQSLRGYLDEHVSLHRVRTIMESDTGSDPGVVEALAQQGVTGILVSDQHGGTGLGLLDAAVAAEQLGATAAPLSFHSACVMAPLAIEAAGSEQQKKRWLPEISSGRAIVSFAGDGIALRDGVLGGRIAFVPDTRVADAFVIVLDDGLALVPRETPGLVIEDLSTVDATRRVGELSFEKVPLDDSMVMPGAGPGALRRIVDAGRIALGADALGAAQRSLDEAVAYSLERTQFGRVIGSFQAVKHMCAEVAAEVEPVRSLMWYAAFAWDERREDSDTVALLFKSHATEVATRATTTSVQVYGGMGFTYECDMHIWFKRAGYDRQMLGGPSALRRQAASARLG